MLTVKISTPMKNTLHEITKMLAKKIHIAALKALKELLVLIPDNWHIYCVLCMPMSARRTICADSLLSNNRV